MGADTAAFSLKINLPKKIYTPGETINGTFYFDFKEGEKKINLRIPKVIIYLLTVESTHQHPEKLKTILASTTLSIPELLEVNNNPNIQFPFQIQIPTCANPSFEWLRANDNMYANYRNYLSIVIPELKTESANFIVIKKISTPLNSSLDLVEHIHKSGFFSNDDITLNVKYDKNSYPLKSKIPFTFSADFSQSKFNIKSMEFTLKRKIKLFEENDILEEIIDELQQKSVQGNMTKNQTENFVANLSDSQEIYKKYYTDKLSKIRGINPSEIINFIPNIKTTLFECEYYIKVKAITDSLLFSSLNPPSMYVPLDVFQSDNYNEDLNNSFSLLDLQPPPLEQSQIQTPQLESSIQIPFMQPFIQNFSIQNYQIDNSSIIENPPIENSFIIENSSIQNHQIENSSIQNHQIENSIIINNPSIQNSEIDDFYMKAQIQNPIIKKSNTFTIKNSLIQQSNMKPIQKKFSQSISEEQFNKQQNLGELDMIKEEKIKKPFVTPNSAKDDDDQSSVKDNKNNNISYSSF